MSRNRSRNRSRSLNGVRERRHNDVLEHTTVGEQREIFAAKITELLAGFRAVEPSLVRIRDRLRAGVGEGRQGSPQQHADQLAAEPRENEVTIRVSVDPSEHREVTPR
jgi:hypothetical protein